MATSSTDGADYAALIGGTIGGALALLLLIFCIVRWRHNAEKHRVKSASGVISQRGEAVIPSVGHVQPSAHTNTSTDSSYADGNLPDQSDSHYVAFDAPSGHLYATTALKEPVVYDTTV